MLHPQEIILINKDQSVNEEYHDLILWISDLRNGKDSANASKYEEVLVEQVNRQRKND